MWCANIADVKASLNQTDVYLQSGSKRQLQHKECSNNSNNPNSNINNEVIQNDTIGNFIKYLFSLFNLCIMCHLYIQ